MECKKLHENKFTVYLLKKIVPINESGCYSPIAVESALNFLYNCGIIRLDQECLRNSTDIYNDEDDLRIINQTFVAKDSLAHQPANSNNDDYESLVQIAPFGENGEITREQINFWIFKASNYKLKSLVPPMIINENTRAVLINFVTFHSEWKRKAECVFVKLCPFYSSPNVSTYVEMMSMKNKVLYDQTDEYQVIGIPYSAKDIVFFVVLPKDRYGLPWLLRRFDHRSLLQTLTSTNLVYAEIDLPIFRFDTTQIFDRSNLLSLLAESEIIENSKDDEWLFFHHLRFEINTYGSNGTCQEISSKEIVQDTDKRTKIEGSAQFFAHHSFLFAVVDIKQGNVIFLGQYCGGQ